MKRINSILCAIDLGAASNNAVREAVRLAEQLGVASLVFVHAFERSSLSTSDGPILESEDQARSDAEARLGVFVAELCVIKVPTRTRAVEGDAAESILVAIEEERADILVIGTTGRTGLRRALLGSVAEGVARRSSAPVLVVRDQG